MEKLYLTDSYRTRFTAQVTACRPWKDGWEAALDATAFYPEGGGQPADTGRLGEAQVLDVQETDGEVWHRVDRPLPVGGGVAGEVDWARRLDYMQQHTGEHMASGIIHRLYGYNNVGFHLGAEVVTIDFDGVLTQPQLDEVEQLVNEAIWRDLPVRAWVPPAGELAALPYRSKKAIDGPVRLVEIPQCDLCACCGTHLSTTGQVGMVKFLSLQHYKGGVRLTLCCGGRALTDYRETHRQIAAIAAMLSQKTTGALAAVQRLKAEREETQRMLGAAQQELFACKAAMQPLAEGDLLRFEQGLSPDGLRRYALALAERCCGTAAVFSPQEGGWRYALASRREDMRALSKELNGALSGRGGGSRELAQGTVNAAQQEIEAFFLARA